MSHERIPIPIAGGTESYISNMLSPERTINMYPVQIPGSQEEALIAIPGTKVSYTHETGLHTRKLIANLTDLFAIYENTVVKHDTNLNGVEIGTLATTSGYVGAKANNTKQLMFVDNVNGYVWDYSTITPSFNQITDPDFPGQPVDVDFLDGRMLVAQSSSNKWCASNIDDASAYNSLNFARLTSDEELCVGIRVVNRRIFVFGNFITEIFYNSGNASQFPYVRDNNNVLQYGCASVASIAQDKNMLVWVASQKVGPPTVVYTTGGPAKKISNAAVDYSLQKQTHLSSIYGYLFSINSQLFYVMNNPDDNITWMYSFSMDKWVEVQMINGSGYFANQHAFYNNKHYLGHANAPKLSELSNDFTTNDNENIHCVRITAPIRHKSLQKMRINRLDVEGNQGSGAETTEKVGTHYSNFELNPLLYMSVSRDNGMSYSGPYEKSIGKVGDYQWDTVWQRLGTSKSFVFKFETFHAARTMLFRSAVDADLLGY
jgi:hypothetical protein